MLERSISIQLIVFIILHFILYIVGLNFQFCILQEIGLATITTGPAVPRAAKDSGEIARAQLSRVYPRT